MTAFPHCEHCPPGCPKEHTSPCLNPNTDAGCPVCGAPRAEGHNCGGTL